MASLDDILTAAKNLVTAVNGVATTYLQVQGNQNFTNLTAATVVSSKAGRIAEVSVLVAGSGTGMVYDSADTATLTRPLFVIPTTVGVYPVNLPVSYGVLVAPGTGQTVSGGFS